ncbi:MAG: 8-oxo-dGDP phosphatase [Solirubrobacteraceae bacterium]|nr:8-oxo-dGDP phosphatase [Solirubrobacteraceae bacterium]
MSSGFERIDSKTLFEGRIITVREDRFRYDDGGEADREIVGHNGAVGIVAHDGEHVYLVRQPREAVGAPDMLELPAGKLDEAGESPEETARRELAEEIGKAAEHWELLHTYYSSVGFSDEQVHVYLATGLSDVEPPETDEDERIEIVAWPLGDLQAAIDECEDAKTLIGLLELRSRL